MFKNAASFNSDVSKWSILQLKEYANVFTDSGFDRTICNPMWVEINAFTHNGRPGCCNKGSYMSNPHNDPFVVMDGGGSCSKCHGLVSLIPNSDVACPTLPIMVTAWLNDEALAIIKYGNISNWNTSLVTRMDRLFEGATDFNAGKIPMFQCLFYTTEAHIQLNYFFQLHLDLSKWETQRVVTMGNMFAGASSFNSDISKWNVSSLDSKSRTYQEPQGLNYMFDGASKFSKDLSKWSISKVTSLERTFNYATAFNSDLSKWQISKVTTLLGLFYHASSFNGDVSTWDVSRVISLQSTFRYAIAFNQGNLSFLLFFYFFSETNINFF